MTEAPTLPLSCTASAAALLQKAEALAKKLDLPWTPGPTAPPQLVYTDRGLELRLRLGGPDTAGTSVLHVDFVGGRCGYRHARNCTINQPLARAVGIRPGCGRRCSTPRPGWGPMPSSSPASAAGSS